MAGGTEPKFGVVSSRTTRVVERRRRGTRCGTVLGRENEREASLEAMVEGMGVAPNRRVSRCPVCVPQARAPRPDLKDAIAPEALALKRFEFHLCPRLKIVST